MTIKLIAVDMDGTFLNSKMEYNRPRFRKLYRRMKEQGVRFVVASGNQYFQLKSFFEDFQDEITYVAENGAYIVDHNEELFSVNINESTYQKVMDFATNNPSMRVIVCGKKFAYVLESDQELYESASHYFHRIKKLNSFNEISDQILKFSFIFKNSTAASFVPMFKREFGDLMFPVTSGPNNIDLIVPGITKGAGLARLCEKWKISSEEVLAFGDSNNDLEMIRYAKFGYAMKNAGDSVKEVTDLIADSNEDDGVNTIIEMFLEQQSSKL